jgi:3-oxoacyl-[acyl-carrier protein] reductase
MVVLVTGAGSGIGRAIAQVFAEEQARVAVTDLDFSSASKVAEGIMATGGCAKAWALDVSKAEDAQRVTDDVGSHFGGIDVLVNNAGVGGIFKAIDEVGFDALWDKMVDVNLTSLQRMIRLSLPYLRKSAAGRVLNIASTEALGSTSRGSAYAASKAGVVGLTRALAVEFGREGITVNAICPGPTETPMTSFMPPQAAKQFVDTRTALRRWGKPEEVAHMALCLSMPGAAFVTGTAIPVDGGLTARNG